MPKSSRVGGWIKNISDIVVLIVLAAKTAIAEPFYVPMEPITAVR